MQKISTSIHRVVASFFYLSIVAILRGGVDQTEDIVQHEVAARVIGLQREALGVVHGLLLLVNLVQSHCQHHCNSEFEVVAVGSRTRSAPVTSTTMPPLVEGWASKVAIWWRTCWKGKLCGLEISVSFLC